MIYGYMWKNNQVVELTCKIFVSDATRNKWGDHLMVDIGRQAPDERYGMFKEMDYINGRFELGWKHVPFEQFPAEFRMSLLLLGIT